MMAAMNQSLTYFMPVMTVLIGFQLPAGLTLYWFFSTLTTGLQQWVLFRGKKKADGRDVIEGEIVEKK